MNAAWRHLQTRPSLNPTGHESTCGREQPGHRGAITTVRAPRSVGDMPLQAGAEVRTLASSGIPPRRRSPTS